MAEAVRSKPADAVFSGGGVKVIGLVGALKVAEEQGYRWQRLAGTSAGALLAALVAAGYSAAELIELLMELDFTRFRDPPLWGRIPLAGPVLSLLVQDGLYLGDALEHWVAERLAARGVHTFGDLRLSPEAGGRSREMRFRYRLQVIAADVSRGRMLVLPRDAAQYGLDADRLRVAAAVRMSASLPFFYRPAVLRWGPRRQRCYIVDGGLLSNFPVWLFDVPGRPRWPTFGFHFVDPHASRPREIRGPLTFLAALVSTMLEAHDARHLKRADFARTIAIPTMGVGTTDFDLPRSQREKLLQAGKEAAERFFRTWNFEAYTAAFRQPDRCRNRAMPAVYP